MGMIPAPAQSSVPMKWKYLKLPLSQREICFDLSRSHVYTGVNVICSQGPLVDPAGPPIGNSGGTEFPICSCSWFVHTKKILVVWSVHFSTPPAMLQVAATAAGLDAAAICAAVLK